MNQANATQVQAALQVVLDDIRARGWEPRAATVHADHALGAPGNLPESNVIVRYGGHEFPVDSALGFGAQVAVIAERLQDDVIDDEQQGWPMSSDGRRLLSPRARAEDGAAWWYDGEVPVAPVGRGRAQDQH
jgi:hypothetical protein